ncbi:MAG TPA: hypothetical protein VN026_17060 [Bacteroidia bacterium]|jgi:hypothetical protein|nr:hypothetical protein [Bacteroidia bacterium]
MKKLFLLLIVIAFVRCNKDQDVTVKCSGTYYNITSPDLLNAKFKTGTYWVYLDSVSLTTDSTVINSYSEGDAGKCSEYHAYGFNMISYPALKASNMAIFYNGIVKNSGGLPSSGIPIYTDFNFPDSSATFNCSRLDSVFIYNRYYKRVEKVTVAKDPSNTGSTKSIYYFNSTYGLIRQDIFNASNVITAKKLLMRKNIVR